MKYSFLDVVQNGTTTPPSPPAAPSNLQALLNNSNHIELTWTDNSDDERFFKIYRSIDGIVWQYVSTSNQNITSFIDKGPFENITCDYRICAMNDGGNSDWSNNVLITVPVELTLFRAHVMSGAVILIHLLIIIQLLVIHAGIGLNKLILMAHLSIRNPLQFW